MRAGLCVCVGPKENRGALPQWALVAPVAGPREWKSEAGPNVKSVCRSGDTRAGGRAERTLSNRTEAAAAAAAAAVATRRQQQQKRRQQQQMEVIAPECIRTGPSVCERLFNQPSQTTGTKCASARQLRASDCASLTPLPLRNKQLRAWLQPPGRPERPRPLAAALSAMTVRPNQIS